MTDDALFHFRARCVRVVDGDTADLTIDVGFYLTSTLRVRLLGIDAPELRSSDPDERARAVLAHQCLIGMLSPSTVRTDWPLRMRTQKADSFGRWLADIWIAETGVSVNGELLRLGHAGEYRR